MSETRYPLCWPEGWKRSAARTRARFGRQDTVYGSARSDGSVPSWNSNRSAPKDPGVAVYWKDRKGRKKCMAVDRYDRVADNIAAIAATLDAMRAIERHGGAEILERTFLGFAQLPEHSGKSWRKILGFTDDAMPTEAQVLHRFRELAMESHPDSGGDHERMVELTSAKRQALAELRVQ